MRQNKVCIKHLQNVTSWRFTYLHRKPYSLLKMIEQLSSFLQLRTKKLFYPYPKMQKSRRLNYGIKKKKHINTINTTNSGVTTTKNKN